MLNLKRVWILLLFPILAISGCAAEAAVAEPTPTNNSTVALEEAVSSPTPVATEMNMGGDVDTAVTPTPANTSSALTQPTQTPIHTTPEMPQITPTNSGNQADTFLVRSINSESGISFEDLAVQRSKEHLSQKIGVTLEEITLVSTNRAELDSSNICHSPTNENRGIENHGITLGYEILLRANGQTYRYVISHNLGYYCAN